MRFFCLLFLFFFSFTTQAQDNSKYSLLWRIEGNGLQQPSYLFGTMHVKDARAFNYSDSVVLAIKKSDYFALEVQPDSLLNVIFNKYFEDNENLRDLLDDSEYDIINERMKNEKGYDLEKLNIKNPLLLKALLTPNSEKEDDKPTFLDAYLYGIAKTNNKVVYGLERIEDQTDIFYNASKEQQKKKLAEVLETSSPSYLRSLEHMIQVYSRGNIEEIHRMVDQFNYNDSIMIQRNRVMTNSMKRLMSQASTFAAVGCAHLPGENGVIHMLRKEGYTVKKVDATFTGVSAQSHIDPLKMEWYDYEDEKMGYALKMPGPPIPADIFPGLNMLMYPDLISETGFFALTIDMRGASKDVDRQEMAQRIVKNFSGKDNFEIIEEKEITKSSKKATEISGILDQQFILMHITVENNILYCQYVTRNDKSPDRAYADYFLNSLRTFAPEKSERKAWISYPDSLAAFTASFPFEPKTTTNPYNYDGSPGLVYLTMATDVPNMANYIIAYNDYPLGYYLDDKEAIYKSLEDEYNRVGTLLSPPKTIQLQGIEGREYVMMLSEDYYTVCRIYLRGNRVYKVLHQNLNAGDKKLPHDNFLSSFTFNPYADESLDVHQPEGADFSIKLFPTRNVTYDSAIDYEWYTEATTTYTLKSNVSGDVYLFEYSDLNDFFKIVDLDSFYIQLRDYNLINWNDSLVSGEMVDIHGIKGYDVVLMDLDNNKKRRHRYWLDNKRLFYISAYVADESLSGKLTNEIFDSYKYLGKKSDFDAYSSKLDLILQGLEAEDTTLYKAALGAFEYYKFTKDEAQLLYAALKKTYADDTLGTGARALMVKSLGNLEGTSSASFLKDVYQSENSTDALQTAILLALINMEDDQALTMYRDLLLEHTPQQLGNRNWSIFRPFTDSLAMAHNHFDALLPLLSREEYKANILYVASQLADSDSARYIAKVESHYKILTDSALEQVKEYIHKIDTDTTEQSYYYDQQITYYLYLAQAIKSKEYTEKLTRQILDSKITGWMQVNAIRARIFNDLKVDKDKIDSLLKSPDTRYSLMKTFYKAGREKEVPEKLRKQSEFAKLCLHEYTSEDYDGFDHMDLLGHVMVDNEKVYVFSLWYDDDPDEKYIGLSGFYAAESDKVEVFKECLSYSPWEFVEEDWKSQALRYIDDMREYGY